MTHSNNYEKTQRTLSYNLLQFRLTSSNACFALEKNHTKNMNRVRNVLQDRTNLGARIKRKPRSQAISKTLKKNKRAKTTHKSSNKKNKLDLNGLVQDASKNICSCYEFYFDVLDQMLEFEVSV